MKEWKKKKLKHFSICLSFNLELIFWTWDLSIHTLAEALICAGYQGIQPKTFSTLLHCAVLIFS